QSRRAGARGRARVHGTGTPAGDGPAPLVHAPPLRGPLLRITDERARAVPPVRRTRPILVVDWPAVRRPRMPARGPLGRLRRAGVWGTVRGTDRRGMWRAGACVSAARRGRALRVGSSDSLRVLPGARARASRCTLAPRPVVAAQRGGLRRHPAVAEAGTGEVQAARQRADRRGAGGPVRPVETRGRIGGAARRARRYAVDAGEGAVSVGDDNAAAGARSDGASASGTVGRTRRRAAKPAIRIASAAPSWRVRVDG